MFNLLHLLIYLMVINLATFIAVWRDKRRAEYGGWRISESSLLILCLLGGSPSAYFAKKKFRHKTRKKSYRAKFWLIVFVQMIVLLFLSLNIFFGIKL